MKKNKFILGVVACAFAALAMTGCSLTLGGDNRASDESVVAAVEKAVADAKAAAEIDEDDDDFLKLDLSNIDSSCIKTVDTKECIDCKAAQSSTTWDTSAKAIWDNPVYGKTDLEAVTISFDLYSKVGASFDSLLTFFKAGATGLGGIAFTENGTGYAQGHGYWDVYLTSDSTKDGTNLITADKWTRITYVIEKDKITAYMDNEKKGEVALTNVDSVQYLTETCDKVAVGVGFNTEFWIAGFVDEGNYLADIRIYERALTATEVADL